MVKYKPKSPPFSEHQAEPPEYERQIDKITKTQWRKAKQFFPNIPQEVWESNALPRLEQVLRVCGLELNAREQALTDSEVSQHLTSLTYHLKEAQKLHAKVWWALPGDSWASNIFETLMGRMAKAGAVALAGWKSKRRPKDHAKSRFIQNIARIYFEYNKASPTQKELHGLCKILITHIGKEVSLDMCKAVIKEAREEWREITSK